MPRFLFGAYQRLLLEFALPLEKEYFDRLYPQFTKKTVRRHKICVLLRCFDSKYAWVRFSFKRALPGAIFMPSGSGELKEKEFLHFQGRPGKRYLCAR